MLIWINYTIYHRKRRSIPRVKIISIKHKRRYISDDPFDWKENFIFPRALVGERSVLVSTFRVWYQKNPYRLANRTKKSLAESVKKWKRYEQNKRGEKLSHPVDNFGQLFWQSSVVFCHCKYFYPNHLYWSIHRRKFQKHWTKNARATIIQKVMIYAEEWIAL